MPRARTIRDVALQKRGAWQSPGYIKPAGAHSVEVLIIYGIGWPRFQDTTVGDLAELVFEQSDTGQSWTRHACTFGGTVFRRDRTNGQQVLGPTMTVPLAAITQRVRVRLTLVKRQIPIRCLLTFVST